MGLITNLNRNVKPKQPHRNYTNGYISLNRIRGSHNSLNGFSRGSSVLVELEFGDFGFFDEKKPNNLERNPRTGENPQQIHQICHRLRIEPEPHWWETSVLTTTPPVLYNYIGIDVSQYIPLVWAVSIINRKITPFLNIVLLEALSPARYFW